jgi:hypothetical protein
MLCILNRLFLHYYEIKGAYETNYKKQKLGVAIRIEIRNRATLHVERLESCIILEGGKNNC